MSLTTFFITGCPRSGTTVLQQALNRHSKVVVPAETKYFFYFYGMPFRWQKAHISRMVRDLRIELKTPEKVIRDDAQHRAMFRTIAERCIEVSGKKGVLFFGEKTPEHANRIFCIRRVVPESKVIYVCRDPRAVVASLLKVPWIECSPLSAVLIWKKYVRYWEHLQRNPDPNSLVVRYEDLVQAPSDVLENVCAFLGIEYESEVAEGYGNAATIPQRELAWKSHSLQQIDTSKLFRWRDMLSEDEIALVERLTGDTMVRMGYQPEAMPPFGPTVADWLKLIPSCAKTATSLTYQCLLSEFRFSAQNVWNAMLRREDIPAQGPPAFSRCKRRGDKSVPQQL